MGSERGQVLATALIMMVVLIGFVALALDLGVAFVARNQVQNIADGSALAGTRSLGNIYQGLNYIQQQLFVCDNACATTIKTAAQEVAAANFAGGDPMTVRVEDVEIGVWDGDNFTATRDQPDAVEVIARRDQVANGPISTFFARVLGRESAAINAVATAALTGKGTTWEGEVELPIGISRYFFDQYGSDDFCDKDIQFYPTNDPASCAGWTSWEYNSNDATLRKILALDGQDKYPSPPIIAGETVINFTGGTLSNPTFDALLTLFQNRGADTDGSWNYILDANGDPIPLVPDGMGAEPLMVQDNQGNWVRAVYPDGTDRNWHKWETTLPVYDRGDCSNPNQSIMVVGFAEIELRDVLNAPDKLVRGRIKCDLVDGDDNRGGGGEYGTKGSIPGLVR